MNRYNIFIVGGGPAGLSIGMIAASEGLTAAILERDSLGGQASHSMLIENLPGFPEGISGTDLADKLVEQVRKFEKAEIVRPANVVGIVPQNGGYQALLADGDRVEADCAVITSGLQYTRHDAKRVGDYLGRGVSYGKATIDPQKHHCVCVVGGGNSAAQAALFAAQIPGCEVKILVRGKDIVESMSEYLIERIRITPNIEVCFNTVVLEARGKGVLQKLLVRRDGKDTEMQADIMQIFIGAKPQDFWLPKEILRDGHGFILTGRFVIEAAAKMDPPMQLARLPLDFETSLPGVFAAGDARYSRTKRITSAIGEASVVVHMLHEYREMIGR